jgi:hypothetical protein
MKKEEFEKNYPEKKPVFRSETKWKILDYSENEFISVSQLREKLNISYKNVIANLNDLQEDEKIIRLSLDEPSNITYILPLSISEFFSSFQELEEKLISIARFSKSITINLPIRNLDDSEITNLVSEARKILLINKNKFPEVKFRTSFECRRINKYKIVIKLDPKKITAVMKPKLKEMDREQRSKLKFDLNGFIKLLS